MLKVLAKTVPTDGVLLSQFSATVLFEAILNTFEQTNYRKLQVIHYLKWNGAPSGKHVGDERFFRPIHGFPLENAT